ncbi:hypothetical protein IMSAG249_02522 [Lachnospiraceae bacterium]|jgi:hypothetical protein|nr:hypothetical protein IMSAGC009_01582 [Lachnospiraceae bacterium]GFI70693.1 hypothetical protein IMSAG249_02522 [Lachnospiraceae bacterium]
MEAIMERTQEYTHTQECIYNFAELPDLNREEYREFRFHFQQSILLSLLMNEKLTRQQYDSCLAKLEDKYYKKQNSSIHTIAGRLDDTVKYK